MKKIVLCQSSMGEGPVCLKKQHIKSQLLPGLKHLLVVLVGNRLVIKQAQLTFKFYKKNVLLLCCIN